jgi:hypothetical protein
MQHHDGPRRSLIRDAHAVGAGEVGAALDALSVAAAGDGAANAAALAPSSRNREDS